MSRQLGLLERAKLEQEFDQAKARAEKLRILHGLGMAIASAMDLEQVLTRIVEAAVFITQAEEGSLLLLDEETQELHLRAQKGLGEKYARGFRIPVRDSIAGEVLRTARPQSLTGTEGSVKVVTGYLVNAILYVPVAIRGRSIGVLAVDNQAAEGPFTEDDENLLLVLAGYAAIALENARLLEESERRFQTLAALPDAGQVELGRALGAGVARIRLGGSRDSAGPQALTPSYLATVVSPCLRAIADLQHVLDALAGRSPSEVKVLAITQDWPVPVSLQGAREAMQALQSTILPWVGEYGTRKEVAVELAVSLVDSNRPGLREVELIGYVAQLLPTLETLLSSPMEVSTLSA
jgi:putative methionine-R-sulfoxide reductase with GAF domain